LYSSKRIGDLGVVEDAEVCLDGNKILEKAEYKRDFCHVKAARLAVGETDDDVRKSCEEFYRSCVDNSENMDGSCSFTDVITCTVSDLMTCRKQDVAWYASWAKWNCSQLKASDDRSIYKYRGCEATAKCKSKN